MFAIRSESDTVRDMANSRFVRAFAYSIQRKWWSSRRFSTGRFEHALALLFYCVMSAALSWPLIRDFTTRVIGTDGNRDLKESIWVLWQVQRWALGKDSLFYTQLL